MIRVRTNIGLFRVQLPATNPVVGDIKAALYTQHRLIPPTQQVLEKDGSVLADSESLASLHITSNDILTLGVKIEKVVTDKSIIGEDGILVLAGTTIIRLQPTEDVPGPAPSAEISKGNPDQALPPPPPPEDLPPLFLAEDCPKPVIPEVPSTALFDYDDEDTVRPAIPSRVMRLLSESPTSARFNSLLQSPMTPQVESSLRAMLLAAGMSEAEIQEAFRADQTRSRSNPRPASSSSSASAAARLPTELAGSMVGFRERPRAGSFSEIDSLPRLQRQASPTTPQIEDELSMMLKQAGLSDFEIRAAAIAQKHHVSPAPAPAPAPAPSAPSGHAVNADMDYDLALAISLSASMMSNPRNSSDS